MSACVSVRVLGVWGGEGGFEVLLVSEACLSCSASVMLFHSSFISSTIPLSDLTAQFTDTALWYVPALGKHVRLLCYTVSHFCQAPLNWQRWDQNQSAEILQGGRGDNSFKIQAVDPDLSVQPNTPFFVKKKKKNTFTLSRVPFLSIVKKKKKTGTGFLLLCEYYTMYFFPQVHYAAVKGKFRPFSSLCLFS